MLNGRPHRIQGRSGPPPSRGPAAGDHLPKPAAPRPLYCRQAGAAWPGDGEN
jgi:hypothetical protein